MGFWHIKKMYEKPYVCGHLLLAEIVNGPYLVGRSGCGTDNACDVSLEAEV